MEHARPRAHALSEIGWWVRIVVLGGWLLAVAASFSPIGDEEMRGSAVHAPFVGLLTAVAAATAAVTWRRHLIDHSRRTFLLTLAFGTLALLYLPHILLESDGADPSHLVFGPISRVGFALLLTAAVLTRPETRSTMTNRWVLVVALVAAAAALDLVVHSGGLESVWGDDPTSFIRGIEWTALLLTSVCAVVLLDRWRHSGRPLILTMAVAVTAMAGGSALFLSTTPWTGRWWTAHLALGVTGVIIGSGLAEEGLRRGSLESAVDLDLLPLLAEHVVEDLRDGLAVFADDGELVGWNPAAARITGWERPEAAARLPRASGDGIIELDNDHWIDQRSLHVTRNGVHYEVVMIGDATDRVALSQTTERLEKANQALQEFIAVAAHDIRSPLSVVHGMVSILKTHPPSDPSSMRQMIDAMERSTSRLTTLTDDLLTLSRIDAASTQPHVDDVDVGAWLGEHYQTTGEIVVDFPEGAVARCDPRHLERIVENLVSNARKYGEAPILVETRAEADSVVIVVQDHGAGVPAAEVPAIFDRFVRGVGTHGSGGTGLGLAIVRELAELDGGSVRYEQPLEGGARFVVEFPKGAGPGQRPPESERVTPARSSASAPNR